MRKLSSPVALSLIALVVLASGAEAAPITVGVPLTGTFKPATSVGVSYLVIDSKLPDAGARVSSPVTGVIVAWHLLESKGDFQLFTMKHVKETTYTVSGESGEVEPQGTGLETFAADLPVKAGETIGLKVPPGSQPGLREGTVGTETIHWQPAIGLGETAKGESGSSGAQLFAFNAEVQPAPTVTGLSVTSGPVAGGTSVTITGTDFEGASTVEFGSTPAPFSLVSENTIVATAPLAAGASSVPITVTTNAGAGTSAQRFVYVVTATTPPPTTTVVEKAAKKCTVPKLTGKKLKVAKKKLAVANCSLGKVTKKEGPKAAVGKVVAQGKKPGTELSAGSAVKVTLGKR